VAKDPKEFPGQRAATIASFNEISPTTDAFVEAWPRSYAKEATERLRRLSRLGILVELDDSPPPKDNCGSSDEDGGDYNIIYC
jgi:hypothetical protein